ncbi:hypothetical protein SLEP1_g25677 [Rubroshorea leprosula]|uniref:Uncharacterized protein n=1 Tax=Rubroshorea leprosula TaxID=152421 RepID=A0AAV5JQ93_9ROSI|nr:hypothetical protein SLEP1_g25677 [Rubroshorea leprosula]
MEESEESNRKFTSVAILDSFSTDLLIIVPPLMEKIQQYANSQKALSKLLNDIQENTKKNPRKYESKELLTQICSVEDSIDSIIARKMLQRQKISIEKVPVKYFVIAKSIFRDKLHKQAKELEECFLSLQVSDEKLRGNLDAAEVPAKEPSGNTVPQKNSFKGDAVFQKGQSISEGSQVLSGNKDVGRDSSVLNDSDESHHQRWEEGSVPVVLEELVSKLAPPELLSRRMRQLHILKANLEYPSDAILLWASYHSHDTKQHFQFRCWVVVSKESGESDILKQISPNKQEASELSNQLLTKRLHDFLVFKSRVLLISKGITSTNFSKERSHQQLEKSKDYLLEESRILGMKDITTELSQSILNQYKLLFLISIVGVAQSENTTFLWAMYNAEDVKQLFQYRAWVHVPKEFKEKDLQDLLAHILEQVTDNKVEEENRDPVTLQKKLCNFLAPKRYLIVLYDAWTTDVWDKLKQALPNSMNGSRVILTVHEANAACQTNSSWIFGTVCGKELLDEKVSKPRVKHRWGRLSDIKANESGFFGLDDKVKELAELLLDSYEFLISVVGLAGSGKTMLVKAIYNSLAIKQHFDCRAFVSVSQVFEARKLLADLCMQLGMVRKDESWSKEELQKRLRIFLAWKRYLIVLDDVHTAYDWETLSLAFPNSANGSRVILTTREASVARHINLHNRVIQLRLLNDDESWELFTKKVQVPEVLKNEELKALRKRILQGCGGLPLNIVVLGGLLSTKDPNFEAWSKVIEQVNQKKESKKKATDEDGSSSSRQQASSYMKQENGQNFITDQSNSSTQHGSLDTKLEDKVGKEEIEETGPREAKPMQEEGKVKHGATNEEQERFLNELASSETKQKKDKQHDQLGSSDGPLSILALGYKDLEPHLKFCLKYLGLFPRSCNVPFRRLFQLLQAEGLVKQEAKKEDSESFEEKVKKYIEDLKKRTFIEVGERKFNGSPKTVRMQDTLYDELSRGTETGGLFHNQFNQDEKETSKQPEFIRRFAEHQEIHYNSLPKCSFQLRSYISFKTERGDQPASGVDKLLKKIVRGGFGLIVILDLEGVYKPVLSKHLGKFPSLKYLGLRWTFLDLIPDSVGDLPCLETLDVKHTNISTLPGEFWKAKYLQHLYMNNICVDTSIPKAFRTHGSLTKLKTLSGLVIRNEKSVDYLKAADGIRKLGVTCHGKSIEKIVEWISMLTQLQSLKLRLIDKSRKLPSLKLGDLGDQDKLSQLYLFGKIELPEQYDSGTFLPNLQILTLVVSELSDDPMEKLGQLENLKVLRLHGRSYKGKTMKCSRGSFLKLEVLKLWMLEELEKWEVEKGAMPAVEEVEIRFCKKLNNIDGLKELTTLKDLLLTNMEQEFVKELKESLGMIVREESLKFSSTWEKNAQGIEKSMASTSGNQALGVISGFQ